MSTAAIKLSALLVRTLAKPIATRIKSQARDHPRFRAVCISLAQRLHRADMRLRLGMLRDSSQELAKIEKAEKERRHAEAIKRMSQAAAEAEAIYPGVTSRVRSDILSPEAADAAAAKAMQAAEAAEKEAAKAVAHGPRIRPLSESKAIDAGANFISEAFLFAVAGGLILMEALRARKKEVNRRDIVAERLQMLEDRNRQDEERLEELERREKEDAERLWRMEVEIWKLKGGKGEMPAMRDPERKEWEKMPLYLAQKKESGWWNAILSWVGATEDNDLEEVNAVVDNRREIENTAQKTATAVPNQDTKTLTKEAVAK